MKRLVYPLVAITTFLIGFSAVAIALSLDNFNSPRPEIPPIDTSVKRLWQPDPATETYAVYSAVIREMYADENVKLLVITGKTDCSTPSDISGAEWGEPNGHPARILAGIETSTITNYLAASRKCITLSPKFDVPARCFFATVKDLDEVFEGQNPYLSWRRFHSRYPGSSGIVRLSNVGFNSQMNQALVYTSFTCGGLCGTGKYILLSRDYGIWKIQSTLVAWIS